MSAASIRNDFVQLESDYLDRTRVVGAVSDGQGRYIRWSRCSSDNTIWLSIEDCLRFLGVKRSERPHYGHLKVQIGRQRVTTKTLPKDDEMDGATVVKSALPVEHLHRLPACLSETVRERVSVQLDELYELLRVGLYRT